MSSMEGSDLSAVCICKNKFGIAVDRFHYYDICLVLTVYLICFDCPSHFKGYTHIHPFEKFCDCFDSSMGIYK
jgi:hypothetical protein